MQIEARVLLSKALDSLFLSVDHFNRLQDRGRPEAVLLFLDRAFELLLKAAIVHKGGKIREKGADETIGLDKCVRRCVSEKQLRCVTQTEALTIQAINSLRDAAQHYVVSLSEQLLYLHAQAGLSLFRKIVCDVFGNDAWHSIPERALPISTKPPEDLATVISADFSDIKKLLAPKSRQRLAARAKIRSLAILESSLRGSRTQPSERQLSRLINQAARGKDWTELFPGVSTLQLETEGSGIAVTLRITTNKGEPVKLVPEDTPGAMVVGVKRVTELDYYSLGARDLSKHLGISMPKVVALIQHLKIQTDPKYFKLIKIGKQEHKRYSKPALDSLRGKIKELDMDQIWKKHGARRAA